jgi:hypothetical protein
MIPVTDNSGYFLVRVKYVAMKVKFFSGFPKHFLSKMYFTEYWIDYSFDVLPLFLISFKQTGVVYVFVVSKSSTRVMWLVNLYNSSLFRKFLTFLVNLWRTREKLHFHSNILHSYQKITGIVRYWYHRCAVSPESVRLHLPPWHC